MKNTSYFRTISNLLIDVKFGFYAQFEDIFYNFNIYLITSGKIL